LIVEDEYEEQYIDNGCSTHFIEDKNKFNSLKIKIISVAFGDNSFVRIPGKGVVNHGTEHVKETNVLLVEDLKHKLINVDKMCVNQW